MKNLLFTLCILSAALGMHAQSLGDSHILWVSGNIYYLNGTQFKGLINRNQHNDGGRVGLPFVQVKSNKNAPEKRIWPDSVRALVCGPDSFVVAHFLKDSIPVFVKVLMDEPVKLYEADKRKYDGGEIIGAGLIINPGQGRVAFGSPILFVGEDADHITQVTRKNFVAVMNRILVKRPALLEKINSKEYEYSDLEQIVNFYNGMRLEDRRTKN